MTDVRLTATNPEDSSVVPVGCNSRGELLIQEVVIEQIDNDVTITGDLNVNTTAEDGVGLIWDFSTEDRALVGRQSPSGTNQHVFNYSGLVAHRRLVQENPKAVSNCLSGVGFLIDDENTGTVYSIDWNGVVTGPGYRIMLEPDNPVHYSSVQCADTGEETKEYIGPVLDVREELEFLRAQVRALMEKLKMSPEGGWPVWDGSTET